MLKNNKISSVLGLFFAVCLSIILMSCPDYYPVHKTYYVAPDGNDLHNGSQKRPWATFEKAAASAVPGAIIYVRGGTYTQRLIITSSGTKEEPITFAACPGEVPIIDGTGIEIPNIWGGLIESGDNSHIIISGFTIQNSGSFGIHVYRGNSITIDHNTISNSIRFGIYSGENSNINIANNTITNSSSEPYIWGGGIVITDTSNFEVSENTVQDGYGAGIGIYQASSAGLVHNNIFNNQKAQGVFCITEDAALSDIDIYANKISSCIEGLRIGAQEGGSIDRLRFFENTVSQCSGFGVWVSVNEVRDLANNIRDIEIYKNSISQNQTGITISVPHNSRMERIKIYNNIIYKNIVVGITVDDYTKNTAYISSVSIINNTVWKNGFGGNLEDAHEWAYGGIFITAPNAQNILIRNNIAAENRNFAIAVTGEVDLNQVVIDHNLVQTSWTYWCDQGGTDLIQGNPLFTDAEAGDFSLLPGSPAINSGSSEGAPSSDFNGTSRTEGDGVDIGAIEYTTKS